MTVELEGYPDIDRGVDMNNEVWRSIRDLAERLGWQPEGTSSKPGGPVNDDYALNNFQYASAADAKNMANALRRAGSLIFGEDEDVAARRRTRYLALCSLRNRFATEKKLCARSFMADWETCGSKERRARKDFLWELNRLHNEELQAFTEKELYWYAVYKKIQELLPFLDKGGYRIY